jgi:hypothetical protein
MFLQEERLIQDNIFISALICPAFSSQPSLLTIAPESGRFRYGSRETSAPGEDAYEPNSREFREAFS